MKPRFVIISFATVFLLASACGDGGQLTATTPPTEATPESGAPAIGKIAFQRGGDIWAMNADGSDQTRLVDIPTDGGILGGGGPPFFAWSPDATRIAFVSDHDGDHEIYVVNADGSGQTNLTNDPGEDGTFGFAWSPDGQRIAFISIRGGADIYVMNADGSGLINLTSGPIKPALVSILPTQALSWSPNGTRIAFAAAPGPGLQRDIGIHVIDADGSGLTRLTTFLDSGPAWSPDGTRIAYLGGESGPGVYVMNADGTGQTNLTPDLKGAFDFAWSPDGTHIAAALHSGATPQIYLVNTDGSGFTQLTDRPLSSWAHEPSWSPDGSRIAFSSNRSGNVDIYVMDADGFGQTRLTEQDFRADEFPSWSPAQ